EDPPCTRGGERIGARRLDPGRRGSVARDDRAGRGRGGERLRRRLGGLRRRERPRRDRGAARAGGRRARPLTRQEGPTATWAPFVSFRKIVCQAHVTSIPPPRTPHH